MIVLSRVPLLLLLCLLAATATLARAQAGEARVWCHLCPWNALNNLSHSRRDFPLGLGMETQPGMAPRAEAQAERDYVYECLSASQAGIDAFALDIIVDQPLGNWLPAVDGYLLAAEKVTAETGRPFYSAPCIDSPGSLSPEDLAAYIEELLAVRSSSPAWPRLDGVPVLWTFGGTAMPAEDWQRLFALLGERGLSAVIVLDSNSLFERTQPLAAEDDPWSGVPTGELDALAELPVALYPFRTDFDHRTRERCLAYLRAKHPGSLAARLSIGTVWPGYWSLGSGWYVDPRGTALIRDSLASASGARWLTVATWNDFYETTHFQPSVGFGTGRLDLLHALLSRWRGEEPWPTEPRLYLWQPNELQVGDAIVGEVLALLPDGAPSMEARVSLCDAEGAATRGGDWLALSESDVAAARYDLGPCAAPPGTCQYLLLEYRAAGSAAQARLSQPICVWPAGYHPLATPRGTLWQVNSQARGPQTVLVEQADGVPVRVVTSWDEGAVPPGSRLHVRRGFDLIHFPGETRSPVVYDMGATYGEGRAPWEVFAPVPAAQRWGFLDTVLVLPDGSLRWSEPEWVAPAGDADLQCAGLWRLDDASGERGTDSSPYGHHAALVGGPRWETPGRIGAGCLRLDGVDDYVSVPGGRFPRADFTVSAWVRPDAGGTQGPQCIYVDINGCVILAIDEGGRLTCSRAREAGWAVVTGTTRIATGEWTHVAATYDQQALRLYVSGRPDGEAPCVGARASNVTAIGCNPFGSRSGFFAGSLDEVRVRAVVATPDEVAAEAGR